MDLFMEYLVQHKRTGKDFLIIFGIIAAAFVLLALSTLLLLVPAVSGIWLLIAAGIVFFAYKLINRTSVEYEYILTNNELDIDRINAKSTRKRVANINFAGIDICACKDDPAHKSEFENSSSITKTIDCTGDGINGVYFIDYTDDNGRTRVIFQPPVSLVEKARKYNPSKIFIYQ